MFSVSNESALITKKLVEIHDQDCITFDSESVLVLIERISKHVISGNGITQNGPSDGTIPEPICVPDTLRSLLHKISCVLNCKCSGGDSDAALEILKLLSCYEWEAKIAIVLATFVHEYAQFSHITKLYNDNPLGELVAHLNLVPFTKIDAIFNERKTTFNSFIDVSIKVTRFIAKFSSFSSKYISKDEEPMAVAFNQFPVAVYLLTRAVVACASHLSQIFGRSEIISSYTETWSIERVEEFSSIHTTFEKQYDVCLSHVEKKREIKYIEKLKLKFDKKAIYANNQKILKLLFQNKNCLVPFTFGADNVGVEALKGKTILLFISDLEISEHEILILKKIYQESRNKKEFQYEIVWLPIVEKMEQYTICKQKIVELTSTMPWCTLQNPSLLKAGLLRYAKEEWRCSKKATLVALDQRGKVVNPNAFNMVCTWGNTAYPFTQTRETEIWSRKEWSLELLVGATDQNIPKWINENKVICLYGGEDFEWISDFVTKAREVETTAEIKLEMVYIGKKSSEEFTEIVSGRSHFWEAESSQLFWKRIESMVQTESHHGAKIATMSTKESILVEVRNIHRLGRSEQGWAMMSDGAGSGTGKTACGKHDVILEALVEFEAWSVQIKEKGFVTALNGYLAGKETLPEDMHVCKACHRPI